jgi:hypothetical protein
LAKPSRTGIKERIKHAVSWLLAKLFKLPINRSDWEKGYDSVQLQETIVSYLNTFNDQAFTTEEIIQSVFRNNPDDALGKYFSVPNHQNEVYLILLHLVQLGRVQYRIIDQNYKPTIYFAVPK